MRRGSWRAPSIARSFALTGPQALRDRLVAAYVDRVQAAAEHDPVAGRAFLRVSGLVDPPRALLRPGLIWRVLRRGPAATPTASAGTASSASTARQSQGH